MPGSKYPGKDSGVMLMREVLDEGSVLCSHSDACKGLFSLWVFRGFEGNKAIFFRERDGAFRKLDVWPQGVHQYWEIIPPSVVLDESNLYWRREIGRLRQKLSGHKATRPYILARLVVQVFLGRIKLSGVSSTWADFDHSWKARQTSLEVSIREAIDQRDCVRRQCLDAMDTVATSIRIEQYA